MRLTRLAAACAVVASGFVVSGPPSAALTQPFGANIDGLWVIGSYERDGVTASMPNGQIWVGGGVVEHLGRGNQVNIARIYGAFTKGCARALGNASGTTWGDPGCSAL